LPREQENTNLSEGRGGGKGAPLRGFSKGKKKGGIPHVTGKRKGKEYAHNLKTEEYASHSMGKGEKGKGEGAFQSHSNGPGKGKVLTTVRTMLREKKKKDAPAEVKGGLLSGIQEERGKRGRSSSSQD